MKKDFVPRVQYCIFSFTLIRVVTIFYQHENGSLPVVRIPSFWFALTVSLTDRIELDVTQTFIGRESLQVQI